MFRGLQLSNIAVIHQITLALQPGVTVVTGEAGAGKSLLMKAIAWCFGEKLQPKEILRTGTTHGLIELTLNLEPLTHLPEFNTFLTEWQIELEDPTEVLLSREITLTGSRGRLNGTPVNRQFLETLQSWCLESQAQHAMVSLLKPSTQHQTVDTFGEAFFQNQDYPLLLNQVAKAYTLWQEKRLQLASLSESWGEHQRELEFLRFQVGELETAQLTDTNEDQQIKQTLNRLGQTETLVKLTKQAKNILAGNPDQSSDLPTVIDLLQTTLKSLRQASELDDHLIELEATTRTLLETVRDTAQELDRYGYKLIADPEASSQLVERLDTLSRLKQKYGPTLADVINRFETLSLKLAEAETHSVDPVALTEAVKQLEASYYQKSLALTQKRQIIATALTEKIGALLKELELPAAQFEVAVSPNAPSAFGMDAIHFLFSANPGEPPRSLEKVASGGELSRVLLAITSITATMGNIKSSSKSPMKTFVYDEIDTGTSGITVQSIARQLAKLAQVGHQVLVITHQPIIAAMADHHIHLTKHQTETETTVQAETLQEKEKRLKVLSRLASGIDTEDETLENFIHRLLQQADSVKSSLISNRQVLMT